MLTHTCSLVEALQTIPDPRRQTANGKHLLVDIIILGFCATLAGANNFVEIALFASTNRAFFQTFLELPNGIPSHDTFNRVFSLLKPQTLQAVLLPWLLARRGNPGDHIHVDGKQMRGSRCSARNLGALHLVSAWAGEAGLTLGQVAVEAKSNEITAMPELLKLLDLQGKIVTTDAMGCQKEVAETVIEGGGDYLLAVKDNQPTLHQQTQEAFAKEEAKERPTYPRYQTQEEGHGRIERRTVSVVSARTHLARGLWRAWLGLRTLVKVVREITERATGKVSVEVSYYISSMKPNAKRIGRAIRSHWKIENGLHWVLDVVFREDARKLYERTAGENVGFLNRLALSLLRGDEGKGSLTGKRKLAGWSLPFLAKLLGFSEV